MDLDREKERKRQWYLKNRDRLKAQRQQQQQTTKTDDSKTQPKSKYQKIDLVKLTKQTCLCFLVLATSSILISYTVDVLGTGLKSWATAIILEIGIIFLAVKKTNTKLQTLSNNLVLASLVSLSFLILHVGNDLKSTQSKNFDRVLTAKLDLIEDLKSTLDDLPKNRLTDRQKILDKASDLALDIQPNTQKSNLADRGNMTSLAARIMLLLLNLIFSHATIESLKK